MIYLYNFTKVRVVQLLNNKIPNSHCLTSSSSPNCPKVHLGLQKALYSVSSHVNRFNLNSLVGSGYLYHNPIYWQKNHRFTWKEKNISSSNNPKLSIIEKVGSLSAKEKQRIFETRPTKANKNSDFTTLQIPDHYVLARTIRKLFLFWKAGWTSKIIHDGGDLEVKSNYPIFLGGNLPNGCTIHK